MRIVGNRLFVVQVVVVVEDQWFDSGADCPPTRFERQYHIDAFLFAATDEEAAYCTAVGWLPGFSDVNHDGHGDLTQMFAVGLHQLEEVTHRRDQLSAAVGEVYGVDLGGFDPGDVDATGVPRIRDREELEVFRVLHLFSSQDLVSDAEAATVDGRT